MGAGDEEGAGGAGGGPGGEACAEVAEADAAVAGGVLADEAELEEEGAPAVEVLEGCGDVGGGWEGGGGVVGDELGDAFLFWVVHGGVVRVGGGVRRWSGGRGGVGGRRWWRRRVVGRGRGRCGGVRLGRRR